MQLIPYLNFNNQCKEAFTFYERSLGGTIEVMTTYGESPAAGQVPDDWHQLVMHARLRVGDAILMASDDSSEHFKQPAGFAVALQVTDPAEADRIFQALSEDGVVTMPIQETFWSQRFGMCTDRFGIPWLINCEQTN